MTAQAASAPVEAESRYQVYFGLGIDLLLRKTDAVFQVSEAGEFFGRYLLKTLTASRSKGRVLEIGTGSGALAILARIAGCHDVTATDINEAFLEVARENAEHNLARHARGPAEGRDGQQPIQFIVSDLFKGSFFSPVSSEADQWDLIFFNPPGWRTPTSAELQNVLRQESGNIYQSMFDGDRIILDFLKVAPRYLKRGGRILLGLNSIVGIRNIIDEHRAWEQDNNAPPLRFELKDHTRIEMLFYNDFWRRRQDAILSELNEWQDHGKSVLIEKDGALYWAYEVVEARLDEAP